jgi:hypothetical protein
MTSAAQIPLRLRAPPGGDANSRGPRDSMRPPVGDFFTIDGDTISRLVIFFGSELA